jgi:ferrous iron transport protein B
MNPLRIALAGNPNSGKTTLFNKLTGSHQKVGNYAGVTVETKEGRLVHRGREIVLYDLPGTYSLTAYSLDEIIARDFVLDEKPDLVIDVLDATNLERNLFLCLQFQELGIPVVGALNIIDQAEAMGWRVDHRQLSKLMGIPIVRTVGSKGSGLEELLDTALAEMENPREPARARYGADLEVLLARLVEVLGTDKEFIRNYPGRWIALKLLEKDEDALKKLGSHSNDSLVKQTLTEGVATLERQGGRDSEILVSEARYGFIHGATREILVRDRANVTMTERIDAVLINRFLGLPLFLAILWAIFQATFTLGAYPQAWLQVAFLWLSDAVRSVLPHGLLQSLLVDGILGGVGSVLSFIPLVIILFLFISLLEDTGYMSRAAFVMDKFLHIFGLHGQSFLPMMLGFGCSVPAIMASRTLKSPKDRIVTVLVTPFMSCGAKLPVYILLAGSFFPAHAGAVVLSVYIVGIFLALTSSWIFRKTVLKGETTPFVMELPPYRLPTFKGVSWHVWDKSFQYFKKAGTVILAASVLIWAVTTFPQSPAGTAPEQALSGSAAGWVGKAIEPVVKPLGFDWKIAIATVTGFAAKETVVSTLGILYKVGDKADENDQSLQAALQADPVFSPLVAYTLMLFTLILAPCFAAQATIRAELGTRWLVFYVLFSIVVSWAICFGVYQIGTIMRIGV